MTELEAVNMLLRLIGSSPVNSLQRAHPDVENAKSTLDRIRKQVQLRGWWFNLDYNVQYTPDSNGEIIVPSEVHKVFTNDSSVVLRGGKLYNQYEQTFTFTDNVIIARQTRLLDWDDMPHSCQLHAAYLSGAQFIRDELEDPQKKKDLERDAGAAMMELKKEDLEAMRYNMFSQGRVQRARLGVQPYSRGNRRFYRDPDV